MNTEDKFYFGKPGQPERFARRDDLYRLLSRPVTISNKAEMGRLASEAVKQPDFTPSGQDMSLHDLANDVGIEIEALRSRASRPGQPERFDMEGACWDGYEPVGTKRKDGRTVPNCVPMKNAEEDADTFDASSLERGAFAEASKSPMLGKLLSAKVMPEGGWRAVQVGSDTLVISFEDADLARDFGRRASTKGYSATSPVATTGRYWNVEVKNG